MQENICYKWSITREELQAGANELFSRIVVKDFQKVDVIPALWDLLNYGDIEPIEVVGN